MHNYQDAHRQWTETRARKLANNTYLEHPDDHSYAIRLHATRIVTYYDDGRTVLDSGGWQTVTTKERMNRYLPRSVHGISQTRGVWYVGGEWVNGKWEPGVPYADGITFHADGTVTGQGDDPRAAIKLRGKLRSFARDYMNAFWAGKVPAPSQGDCWGCLMRTEDGTHGMGGSSHIIEHMKERYYVPSALACAIEAFPVSRYAMHSIGVAWNPEEAAAQGLTLKRDDLADRQLVKSLTRWLYREMGLPA